VAKRFTLHLWALAAHALGYALDTILGAVQDALIGRAELTLIEHRLNLRWVEGNYLRQLPVFELSDAIITLRNSPALHLISYVAFVIIGFLYNLLCLSTVNAKLDQRLKRAAKKVCGLSGTANPLREAAANQQCFAKAFAEARRAKVKVQQTMLAAR
jgi:hypothetical protein